MSYFSFILKINKYIYGDLSLMVKRMTFNHSYKGSSPLDLIKYILDVNCRLLVFFNNTHITKRKKLI